MLWELTEDGNAIRTDGGAKLFIRQKFEVFYEKLNGDFGIFGNEIIFDTSKNEDDARSIIEEYVATRNKMEEEKTNGQTDSET